MKEWLKREFKMVIKNGFGAATFACNALINMYFESRKIRDGRGVFDGLKDRNAVSWNSLVAGMVTNGLYLETLDLFYICDLLVKAHQDGFLPRLSSCVVQLRN